jgi:hypothetical protein
VVVDHGDAEALVHPTEASAPWERF